MKKGFTLAEVLVTLGIVAVIAVLTIPALVKNYKYRLYSSTLKKAYGQVSDAVQQSMADEMTSHFLQTQGGTLYEDGNDHVTGPKYFLNHYFKVARDNCGNASPPCVAPTYNSPTGEAMTATAGSFGYCVQTTNGISICMINYPGGDPMFIDINGTDQPNITGIDAFVVRIKDNGTVEDWSDNPAVCNTKSSEYNHAADYATGCLTKAMKAGWVIEPFD